MCFGLDILGINSGQKKQAKALEEQAKQERLLAQAGQQNFENQIAQQKASEDAKALLSKPVEETSVVLGETTAKPTQDTRGRRKTTRSTFQLQPSQSGLGGL